MDSRFGFCRGLLTSLVCSMIVTGFGVSEAFAGVFDMRSRALVEVLKGSESVSEDSAGMAVPEFKIVSSEFDGVPMRFNKVADLEEPEGDFLPAVVEMKDISRIGVLEDIGCRVLRTRANFAIICIPLDKIEEVENSGLLLGATASQSEKENNRSRDFSKIAAVHSHPRADGMTGYRGRGVVTGFCDIGFDPTHFVFGDRVALMVDYRLEYGQRMVYESPESARAAGADRDYKTHGTHVANILAGGIENNPYYGYAPEATIVATTSDLYDAALLCGIEDIIEYSKASGKPCVVNLSVGCFTGPHDGTDIVSRYLALLTEEVPICFSAGNYGKSNVYFKETFGVDQKPVGAFYEGHTWQGFDVHGINDIWSADNRPFEISFAVYDFTDRKFVYETPWMTGDFAYRLDSINTPEFENLFPDSYLNVFGGVDRMNGRYNMAVSFSLKPEAKCAGGWARYYVVARLRGEEGVTVESFADGYQAFFHTSGIIDTRYPRLEGCASNFCYAPGVFSIGAYNSANTVPVADGREIQYEFNVGEIADWSSHYTNIHGKSVPEFSAPGNMIVSAMSERYYNEHPDGEQVCREWTDTDGRTYRWYSECGTSMSSPAVAGIFATWLEADPSLTPADLRRVALATIRTEGITDLADPRWGAGAIDAEAGLEEILRAASLSGSIVDVKPVISVSGGNIRVTAAGQDVDFEVRDMAGRRICPEDVPRGIYVVKVNGPCPLAQKIMVK